MPNSIGLPPGPYSQLETAEGRPAPWYMIPFDKTGRCEGPRTRDALVGDVRSHDYTDIYLFSHGWNNDWQAATGRYRAFISGYIDTRAKYGLAIPDYRPMLIGITWPSTALVMPWEEGPRIAGRVLDDAEHDEAVAVERARVRDLASELPADRVERFYELAQQPDGLSMAEAGELVRLLRPTLAFGDEVASGDRVPDAETLLRQWQSAVAPPDDGDDVGAAGNARTERSAAGILANLDPRNLVRMATLWRMKDRAGTIGTLGVGPLLHDLIGASPNVRVHLIGHSFGAKVILSAIAAGGWPAGRCRDTVLLLQPAVSCFCFAEDGDGRGHPGGYRVVLDRVATPILSTFSSHDIALTRVFHLALRRRDDEGEMRIAAASTPSRFAALGGYGPQPFGAGASEFGVSATTTDPRNPAPYTPGTGAVRVIGLWGDATIAGHGDISNCSTWAALYWQVATHRN